MDPAELLLTALRAVGVYLLMLVVVRLLGKREIGSFTAFDFLVALMLGEVVDEIIYGDVTFAQGAVAILVIGAAQYVTGWLSFRSARADKVLDGIPTVVVRDGELQREQMRAERMNEMEVMALLRLQGIDDLREVKLAVVEVGGQMSVLKQEWAEPLQKADLGGKAAEEKNEITGGRDEPSEDERTDSPRALAAQPA
jgi:uncharacterized membrane protein YcaP (DUF421 family)